MEAVGVLLVIAFALGSIFVLMNQAKKARETCAFNSVVSWTFGLVFLSLVTLFCSEL